MELKDFNLELVAKEKQERGKGVKPIVDCIINGKRYFRDSENRNEENIYIPIEWLKEGCIMSIAEQKRTWLIKLEKFMWQYYIQIWEVPYAENGCYSFKYKYDTMRKEKVKESILIR